MNTPKGDQTIFAEALRLPPEERAAYLAQVTHGNPELRQEVESLLQSYGAGEFLEQSAAPQLRSSLQIARPLTEKTGDRIGRYKLLQQIGEGGCGVVYMAEQSEPVRRRVALKIIKLGMDTKSVIARFEAERQALAMMDHPNIAKVFDAGATETGRPYFVMELVRGKKITDYCDEKKLPTRERLDLFIQVCHAIQHAHQKGIIHRDVKPSNIIVTVNDGVAVPKVIDFGIAKATGGQQLTDKTVFTAFEQFIGTPAYMSPEQAVLTSLDIDTRSDIYALGVLLYELLTGQTPFDAKELLAIGLDEMRRTIREKEPDRPSTRVSTLPGQELSTTAQQRGLEAPKLVSELRGDLDWIVMKCLEKDRARRYGAANALGEDVQRHLSHMPVSAGPPGVGYRAKKFAQRNKRHLQVATTALAAIIAVLGYSVWQAGATKRLAFREASRLNRNLAAAQLYINQKRWPEAGHSYAKALGSLAFDLSTLERNDEWLSLKMSCTLLSAGESNAYEQLQRKLCAEMTSAGAGNGRRFIALFLGSSRLSQVQVDGISAMRRWYQSSTNHTELNDTTRALAEYRAGNWREAERFSLRGTQKDEVNDQAIPLAIAAMSAWRLGETNRAWRLFGLARVVPQITTNMPSDLHLSPLIAQLVAREAAETVGEAPAELNDQLQSIVKLLRKADRLGREGRWEMAAEPYKEVLQSESFDLQIFEAIETCLGLKMAAAFLMNGDGESYLRLCNDVQRISVTELRDLFMERHANILLLGGDLDSHSRLRIAAAMMRHGVPPKSGEILYYWWYNAEAMADFWNGDYEASLHACRIAKTSKESTCRVKAWAIEGMAKAMKGDSRGAADAIRIAEAMLDDEAAQANGDYHWNWHDVPIAKVLLRQGHALLRGSENKAEVR